MTGFPPTVHKPLQDHLFLYHRFAQKTPFHRQGLLTHLAPPWPVEPGHTGRLPALPVQPNHQLVPHTHLQTDCVLQRVTLTHTHTNAHTLPTRKNLLALTCLTEDGVLAAFQSRYRYLLKAVRSAHPARPGGVLYIASKDVTFLVDSGATILTLVATEDFVSPSNIKYARALCTNGLFITEPYSSPLKGHWTIGGKCVTSHHKVVISKI